MSKSTKIIAVSLVLLLVAVLFTACGKKEKYEQVNKPSAEESVDDIDRNALTSNQETDSTESAGGETVGNSSSGTSTGASSQKPSQKPSPKPSPKPSSKPTQSAAESTGRTEASKPESTSAKATETQPTSTSEKPSVSESTKPSETGGLGIGQSDPNLGGDAWW